MKNKYFSSFELKLTILLTIIVNLCGVFYPILRNDDPPLYANIAKHIVLSNDWINLISNGHDWLDKPHFPFWLTAISFKLFGITSFAYIFPGFLFHLLGAYFTYKLTKLLYDDEQVSLTASLIYLSALHLMMSSIDIRAEAYLLGEIMGACYFWYCYDKASEISIKYLFMGALFTALALMTKGPFVLVTITGGLIFVWIYTKNISNLIKIKWLIALLLSLLFTLPEIYALYLQFDLHPEKFIFNHYNVSGVRFFFWDSQFGRFFNNGPIISSHTTNYHYLFFIHTFLWAFLPWSILFIYVIYLSIKELRNKSRDIIQMSNWYLYGSFIPTFILFSCSTFQLDHYTNIIMPFAAILCAAYLYRLPRIVLFFQIGLAYCLVILVISLVIIVFGYSWNLLIAVAGIIVLLLFILLRKRNNLFRAIIYPSLALNLVFMFMLQVNHFYSKYDLGYQANLFIAKLPPYPTVDYKVNSLTLEFYTHTPYIRSDTIKQLDLIPRPYYMVITAAELSTLDAQLGQHMILSYIYGTTIDKVMANLLHRSQLKNNLVDYAIVKVY